MSVCKCGHSKVFHMLNGRCVRFVRKVIYSPVSGQYFLNGARRSISVQCKCEKYEERAEDAN